MERKSEILRLSYPTQIDKNIDYRVDLVDQCLKDPGLAADVKLSCKEDILFWIDNFSWTKDPRRDPDILPFICYDSFQTESILEIQRAIDVGEDLLGEKSRDMGASWMVLYVLQHYWLFKEGSDFRIGSRKEEFVDKPNDIDTLFEKLRFNLYRQPKFLMPKGFDVRKHASHMRLINPELHNAIIGESANADFGSGGRRKAVLLDEFSKWEPKIADAAWTSTADVTKCRIPISTPKGSGNKFALLAKGTHEKINKLTLHWTLHPIKAKGAYILKSNGEKAEIDLSDPKMAFKLWQKNEGVLAPDGYKGGLVRSPWYDQEAERRSESEIAQELDINYLSSGYPFFELSALKKQVAYKFYARIDKSMPIPAGRYIQGILVERDLGKVEFIEKPQGWLKLFEMPHKSGQYVNSGDVSEGLPKGDESFGVVRDKLSRDVVATYSGIIDPDTFTLYMQKVGRFFNNAITAPENNNHGYSVCSDLKKMDCNLYNTMRYSNNGDAAIIKAGWSTTATSRPQMLDQLAEEIRKQSFEMRDEVLIAQCETFVKNERNGKPEADGSYLDDGVLALAICGMVIQEKPYRIKQPKRAAMPQDLSKPKPKFKFGRKKGGV